MFLFLPSQAAYRINLIDDCLNVKNAFNVLRPPMLCFEFQFSCDCEGRGVVLMWE